MTEAELIGLSQEFWSHTISLLTVFITLLSGYLVVAYLVGKKLTFFQVSIVSVLYISLSSLVLFAVYAFTARATETAQLAMELTTQRTLGPTPSIAWGLLAICVCCTVASLIFMWNIRHSKGDESVAP